MPDQNVHVVSWPEGPADLRVAFAPDPPATVVVATDPDRGLTVRMAMAVRAEEPVPLCIRLCEPICVTSEYQIEMTVFDRPVMSMTVRGTTTFAECRDTPK